MRIVVLTGAGISAESGLATFRGSEGLWEGHRVEDVATPEAYARDPELVQSFYNARRAQLSEVEPNEAHRALMRLEQALGEDLLLVTQNVEDLHDRCGHRRLLHMHGELRKVPNERDEVLEWDGDVEPDSRCPEGGGRLRPHIVWFGEVPLELPRIFDALERCDLFCAIGTSGVVYPAAGMVDVATRVGTKTVEINLEATGGPFGEQRIGPAGEEVPRWVDEVLADLQS